MKAIVPDGLSVALNLVAVAVIKLAVVALLAWIIVANFYQIVVVLASIFLGGA